MTSSTPPRPAARLPSDEKADQRWLVYVLLCADGTLYTGCTCDLARRLRAHAGGKVKYTRARLPVQVLYTEPAPGRGAAQSRESAIKRLRRTDKLALAKGRGCP